MTIEPSAAGGLTEHDVQRLIRQLSKLRGSSVHAVRSWVDATEQSLGGRLVLQAPSKSGSSGKGHLPEAAFQSHFWQHLLGDVPRSG